MNNWNELTPGCSILFGCEMVVGFLHGCVMASWSGPAAAKHPWSFHLHASQMGWAASPGMPSSVYTEHDLCPGVQTIQFYTHPSREGHSRSPGLGLRSFCGTILFLVVYFECLPPAQNNLAFESFGDITYIRAFKQITHSLSKGFLFPPYDCGQIHQSWEFLYIRDSCTL